ncbi:MAG: hypothetical protein JWM31_824 [Solirubrobacterales bacterium]|nr:hypothetical protein [Solirubrobacterales bacterium]
MPTALQDRPPFAGHSPQQERPLGAYLSLAPVYTGLCGAFGLWLRRADRTLPERVETRDLVVLGLATHKASRILTKSRALSAVRAPFTRFQGDAGPGEVDEAARGHGVRRAVGELLVCPYCVAVWIATLFACGLVAAPRFTRFAAGILTMVFGSDVVQLAYARAEKALAAA